MSQHIKESINYSLPKILSAEKMTIIEKVTKSSSSRVIIRPSLTLWLKDWALPGTWAENKADFQCLKTKFTFRAHSWARTSAATWPQSSKSDAEMITKGEFQLKGSHHSSAPLPGKFPFFLLSIPINQTAAHPSILTVADPKHSYFPKVAQNHPYSRNECCFSFFPPVLQVKSALSLHCWNTAHSLKKK